jgi:hypothetical protein
MAETPIAKETPTAAEDRDEFMTEVEIVNNNTPDFYSQAQLQLSNFIKLTSLYHRKIPHKAFADFNELIFDRREELRDQEYMDIMEHLARQLPMVAKECCCSADSHQFCHSGIDDFIYCRNYSKWSAFMPQMEFIRFTREHPSYSNKQLYEFLKEYCSEPLEIKIGINPDINSYEIYKANYLMVINNLIELCEANPICGVGRALQIIMNFKFCLENIPVYVDDPKKKTSFYKTIYDRCDILSEQCVSPITQKLRQILGWPDCPFKTIKRLMSVNRHLPGFEEIPV